MVVCKFMAALQLWHTLYGAPMAQMMRCPSCRGDAHATALARATATCPICLAEHAVVAVLIHCGHPYCEGCLEELLDRHDGEPVIDMRPVLAPAPAAAEVAVEEEQDPFLFVAEVEEYEPPPPMYGEEDSDAIFSDGENEAMVEDADTLPLQGGPRPKMAARPPTAVRPLHPPAPSPVAHIDYPPWASPSPWNFAFMWEGELAAWVMDHRHDEHTLINPVTYVFITSGSFVMAPPSPFHWVSLWRHTHNAFNRRWTLIRH